MYSHNTPLNTFIRPVYALKQPIKPVPTQAPTNQIYSVSCAQGDKGVKKAMPADAKFKGGTITCPNVKKWCVVGVGAMANTVR